MPPTWTLCPPRDWPIDSRMSWSDYIADGIRCTIWTAMCLGLGWIVVVL